jgi:hypothetical protein
MTANEFLHGKLYGMDEISEWPCQQLCGGTGEAIYHNVDGKCKHPECHPKNDDRIPTYHTMPIQDLIARLVEMGEWEKFEKYSYHAYMTSPCDKGESYYIPWFCQQPRFSELLFDFFHTEGLDKLTHR